MKKITKAVIPCGGMGTRFLPITKAVPKEILPIVDTPVLSYIVDEAIESGITDILIVINAHKEMIKEYFTPNPALEETLERTGKSEYAQKLKNIYSRANITFAYQDKPLGSAHAILQAESFTGDEPFALAWGDDLILGKPPVMGQLIGAYERYGASILGVQKVLTDDIVKYGVAKISSSDGRAHKCEGIVEKPALHEIPSRLTSLGRYILTPAVYDEIRQTKPGKGGELQLTDTLNAMCSTSGVYAYEFEGKRYDMGDKFGAMQATVELGLMSDEYGEKFRNYLKNFAKTLD
ncbi:MAG: UTP--glucose-1-phosphate uridylyltransferase [Clostridia bacterium]|nr:UTP--glucose-1-phosphate uridylyltransferase [Clostridia bacterium]